MVKGMAMWSPFGTGIQEVRHVVPHNSDAGHQMQPDFPVSCSASLMQVEVRHV